MAKYKWVGDGQNVIPGVPTRDLTTEESARYADIIKATQENTGLVLYVADSAPKKSAEKKDNE